MGTESAMTEQLSPFLFTSENFYEAPECSLKLKVTLEFLLFNLLFYIGLCIYIYLYLYNIYIYII